MKTKRLLTMMLVIAVVAMAFTAVFTTGVAAADVSYPYEIDLLQNGPANGNLVVNWYGDFTRDINTDGEWLMDMYDPALDTANEGITVTVDPDSGYILNNIQIQNGAWDTVKTFTDADLDSNNQLVITNDMLSGWDYPDTGNGYCFCLWVSWKVDPDAPPSDLPVGWTWVSGRDTAAINYIDYTGEGSTTWNTWGLSSDIPTGQSVARIDYMGDNKGNLDPTMMIFTGLFGGNYVDTDTLLCTFTFTGTGVQYYTRPNLNWIADIKVDVVDENNQPVVNANATQNFTGGFHDSTPAINPVAVTGLDYGKYTVKITYTGVVAHDGIVLVRGFAYDPGPTPEITKSDDIITTTDGFAIDGGDSFAVGEKQSIITYATVSNMDAAYDLVGYGVRVYDSSDKMVDCKPEALPGAFDGEHFAIRVYGDKSVLVPGEYKLEIYIIYHDSVTDTDKEATSAIIPVTIS